MNTRQRQSGMSMLGILAILLMVGFFILCAIRIIPPYTEYLTVRGIVSKMATETDPVTESPSDIRRKFANLFNTNQIYELDYKDVEIYSKGGKTYIDANYEVRLPIIWRIDAVLKLDDLFYEVGNPRPLPKPPAATK
jgi:Domain of unknown function (DUF4845)